MSIWQAIIYGIVQGLGEFLPISSTAHLKLLPWIFNWQPMGQTFDVALHGGTLFAVIIFFWKDWIRLFKAGFSNMRSNDGKLFWFIVIACIPGGLAGLLFESQIETILSNELIIAAMLIIMGVVLYAADKLGKSEFELEQMTLGKSLAIGISQALALIPGVSRSGITMAAGRFAGVTRESAAKFTFLLSTPLIFAVAVYKIKDLVNVNIEVAPFITAVVVSAVVGALSIKFLLDYLKKRGFGIFVIYRFALGGFVILLYFLRASKII